MMNIQKLKKLLDIDSYKALLTYSQGYKLAILKLTLISILNAAIGIYIAIATKNLIDFTIKAEYTYAFRYGIIFAALLLCEIALTSYLSYKSLRVSNDLKNNLQLEFIDNVFKKNWLKISQYNTGDLSTRLYDDIQLITNSITQTIPTIIALFVQIIMGFTLLAIYDLTLALLTFTITPIAIIFSMLLGLKLKKIQARIQFHESTQCSKTNESFSNLTILKTFNYTHKRLSEIQTIQQEKFIHIKERNTISIISNIILSIGYNLGFFSALVIGAVRLSSASISFGMLLAFVELVGRIQGPLHYLALQIPSLIASFSSIDRIEELKKLPDEHSLGTVPLKNTHPTQIDFEHVSFAYNKEVPVLTDITLSIPLGSKIALIGASGEGKTTLINILLALIEPDSGQVTMTFDDHTVHPMNSNYRHHIAYVSQTNMLFTGTIRDNFLLTDDISEEKISRALTAACCDEFIQQLDCGSDTLLLEDGLGLSQGQLQRISIARALIHDRPFLIFDEATSSLDNVTEEQLIQNIKNNYKHATLIAITHREGILSICDSVYRIQDNLLEKI